LSSGRPLLILIQGDREAVIARKRPGRDERRAVLPRSGDMPDGLLKVTIIGALGFFIGAAIVGWVYG
jgi:hypothetical protein